MKKLISLLLAASISFCLAACGNSVSLPNNSEAGPGNDSQGDVKRITIGTAGTSGALYPMGVAMAETITNHVNGITATGESTAASIENLRNLHDGKMAMGISMSEICAYAYHGQADYEGSDYSDIRAMFSTINLECKPDSPQGEGRAAGDGRHQDLRRNQKNRPATYYIGVVVKS